MEGLSAPLLGKTLARGYFWLAGNVVPGSLDPSCDLKVPGSRPCCCFCRGGGHWGIPVPIVDLRESAEGSLRESHGMGKGGSTFISTSETVGICDKIGQRQKAPRKAPHCFPTWWLCLSKQGDTMVPCAEEVCSQWCQLEDSLPRYSQYWSWMSDACGSGAVCEVYFITRALFCFPRPPQLL